MSQSETSCDGAPRADELALPALCRAALPEGAKPGERGAWADRRAGSVGRLSAREIVDLHSARSATCGRDGDQVDRLGARVAEEIEQVMAMIGTAEGTALDYRANLTDVTERLGSVRDHEGVRTIVENLVLATREMESKNVRLQRQLQTMWQEVGKLRQELDTIRTESVTDSLTSLGNRKFFNTALDRLIQECHDAKAPLALMFADVDHFKRINDTFGHVVGDRVLRFVATTIKQTIGRTAVAARYGGEEFAIILPRTALPAAIEHAEQLRLAIMQGELVRQSTGEKHSRVTISIGVAALHARTTAQALVETADVCLYAAKRSGRNCVVGEKDERLLSAVAS
jgi:diguanylate cyclase